VSSNISKGIIKSGLKRMIFVDFENKCSVESNPNSILNYFCGHKYSNTKNDQIMAHNTLVLDTYMELVETNSCA